MLLAPVLLSMLLLALEEAVQSAAQSSRLRVFFDCGDRAQPDPQHDRSDGCSAEYLRDAVAVVDYVRDRTDADVHVLVTRAATASRGTEFTMAFIGQRRFDGTSQTLRVMTESAETEDSTRQRLASALTLGVLGFVTKDAVPSAREASSFPYSMYTRRQLRLRYGVGAVFRRYREETLFGKLEETRGGQEISATYDQRERWGALESRDSARASRASSTRASGSKTSGFPSLAA